MRSGKVYGTISTQIFVTFQSHEPVQYHIFLNTNASLSQVLKKNFIYSLTGKLLLLNTPAQPTLNYFPELVTKVCAIGHWLDEKTDKAATTGIGIVVSLSKEQGTISNEKGDAKKMDLVVIVNHSNWDPIVELFPAFYLINLID